MDHRYIYRYFLAWTCCRDIFGLATVILPDERISRILTEDIVRDYYFATTDLHIYECCVHLITLAMLLSFFLTIKT